ncbi:60S ribosomal protein L33, putative [Theileria equi strain WA]|uniref:60S ribosomal protein L33, putative n=1 Tax=Theileria equi strain WA TaxID=1537102 RepID=L0B0B1_THEEQ|nr:60S ribosomal protein L33, putative [Theileria equi strain WA]AFZ80574.1 60S ribosomal protein L33, putative [Theileria equi strain WA]|eukprot:XP_004830240.1 60S ribosomal protein L33, putative [Theileria equi strain WA]
MNIAKILVWKLFFYLGRIWSWKLQNCHLGVLHSPSRGNLYTLFAKKKAGRVLITLECTEARKLGKPPSRYYTTKNKINTPQRLELMKYNKYLKRHTLHKEIR